MRALSTVIALLGACVLQAQVTLTGRVVDATSQEPLAFVPLTPEGARSSAVTDIDGKFTLTVPALPATLRFSYVGYEAQLVTMSDTAPVLVHLKQSNTQLAAVEITYTENPAHRIIRRTYAGRKENDGLRRHPYRYTSYSKTTFTAQSDAEQAGLDRMERFDPDTTVHEPAGEIAEPDTAAADTASKGMDLTALLREQHLFLIESATKKSFIPPAAEKEEVLAMRVSGLKDPSFMALVAQTKTFSIYDPQIAIGDKNYLGPIGPSSTSKYFFLLEDTLYQGTDSIYVISYRPKKGTKFDGLQGLLYINTNGYAVQNVTAEPMDRSGLSIRFQQKHERLPTVTGGHAWFPVQLNTFIYMNSVSINGLHPYGVGRAYLKDIAIDADIERKEVRGPELVMDRLSVRRDEAFWNGLRADSLGSKDLRTYTMIDSLGEAEHFDRKVKVFTALSTGRVPIGPVDLLLDRILNYNAYEGFRLGAGLATNDRVTRYGTLGGYFAYGFKDEVWKYGGDLTVKPVYGRDLHLKLSYENDVAETGGVGFPGQSKTFTSESYRYFYMDRMDRIERAAGEVMFRAGSSLKLWVGTERALRVNTIGYQYAEDMSEGVTRLHNDFLTGSITFGLRWAFHERLARLPDRELALGTKWPIFHLQGMRAVKGLWDGEWETWRVNAMVEKTFRIRLFGDLSVRVLGGVADPDAPMPFLFDLRGTGGGDLHISADNTFQTMLPNEFLADRYASLHVRHSFGTLLFKGKYFKPKPSILASAGIGELTGDPAVHRGLPFRPLEKPFYEAGVRIDDILRSGFSGIGVGAFYRLGDLAFPDAADNLVFKLALTFGF